MNPGTKTVSSFMRRSSHTQISEEMCLRAAVGKRKRQMERTGAGNAFDPTCPPTDNEMDDARAALEAALSGHVVVPIADLTELVRVCNGAEHDAKSVARKLVGHYMQHNVEVLAHTFKLIREKIKDHLPAPPVPEMEG